MRSFSEIEKNIVFRIIELDTKGYSFNVLANLVEGSTVFPPIFPNFCYLKFGENNSVSLYVSNKEMGNKGAQWLGDIDKKVSGIMLSIIDLFEFLVEEKFVYLTGDHGVGRLGNPIELADCTQCNFLDAEFQEKIYKLAKRRIFVTESLLNLARNGFLSDEERRYQSELKSTQGQLKLTRGALLLSFLGLLSSIVLPVVTTTSVSIENKKLATELVSPSPRELLSEFQNSLLLISDGIKDAGKRSDAISGAVKDLGLTANVEGERLNGSVNNQFQNLNLEVQILNRKLEELTNVLEATLQESQTTRE